MPLLDGVTAFITGASRGIGQQIALLFAEEGADVALVARSEGVHETAEMIDNSSQTLSIQLDVAEEEEVKDVIQETVAEFDGLDCVVNNAAIIGPTAPVEEVSTGDWQQTMDINVRGVFHTVKHAIPHLRQSDQARIINISSSAAKSPIPNRTPYQSSKMAVIGFTRSLAVELGDDDITANAICPGATQGSRIERSFELQAEQINRSPEEIREKAVSSTLLGTLVEERDIADLALFLASPRAEHITGQDINVSAGSTVE